MSSAEVATSNEYLYDRKGHAAASTGDYVFHQLIPYIGNKRKLLGLIGRAITETSVKPPATFLDLFAGSGVVSRMAKKIGFRVWCNDWEPYAEAINGCYIARNAAPAFAALGGYENALATLNALPPQEGWVTRHLCPADDAQYDIERDRLFYTRANGMKMDAIREQIEQWKQDAHITAQEEKCLLAPLLYQACYVSNTSGVFKGFHNGWGGQTGTALYRILSGARLSPAVFYNNGQDNRVYREDASLLAQNLRRAGQQVDIAYLDPPYNQHPYGSNYHVLNTLTLWDSPPLTEKIEGRNKAAIREDWRTERRSPYNHSGAAMQTYSELMDTLDACFILTSYSTDGMIPLEAMLDVCTRRGRTTCVLQDYKRYRVSAQRFSQKPVNVEFVVSVDTERQHDGPGAVELADGIRYVEQEAVDRHSEIQRAVMPDKRRIPCNIGS